MFSDLCWSPFELRILFSVIRILDTHRSYSTLNMYIHVHIHNEDSGFRFSVFENITRDKKVALFRTIHKSITQIQGMFDRQCHSERNLIKIFTLMCEWSNVHSLEIHSSLQLSRSSIVCWFNWVFFFFFFFIVEFKNIWNYWKLLHIKRNEKRKQNARELERKIKNSVDVQWNQMKCIRIIMFDGFLWFVIHTYMESNREQGQF